jgi:hypothetical protein
MGLCKFALISTSVKSKYPPWQFRLRHLNLCFLLRLSNEVSHPHKTREEIIIFHILIFI